MATAVKSQKKEELVGVYSGTRFRGESGYTIGYLENKTAVLGTAGETELIPGIEYRFIGNWQDSEQWGKQFKFSAFVQHEPHTRNGVVQYLRKFTPHVGEATAHRLCDLYGENACIGVLKTNPEKVAEDIPALRNGKAQEAAAALIEQEKFQETRIDLLDLFAGRGFPGALIDHVIAKWGIHAAKRIKKDPFCLLTEEMPGCGFLRVDNLYRELGHEPERITRRVVCAWHCVREDRTGSVWVSWKLVKSAIEQLITNCQRVELAIEIAVAAGWLIEECFEGEVYLAEKEQADHERKISEKLRVLA